MTELGGRATGHHYRNIVGHGSTQIHAGDSHFHTVPGLTLEQQCCQAFKTSTYEEYKNRNPSRVEGTCQWVLTHPQFQQWRQSEHHDLLWISADPGCGKSVLARSLVDRDLCDDGQVLVCYFFFKDNEEQNNLASALCAILHQLLTQRSNLIRHALQAWQNNGDKIQNEAHEMWRILQLIAKDTTVPPIMCVIDALDECREQDRRQLISLLCDFIRPATTKGQFAPLKFLVTSRPYDCVQRWFEHTTSRWPHIRLRGEDENEQIRQEINLVSELYVRQLAAEFALSRESQDRLQSTLGQMQHRTYLWLYLAIDEIRATYLNSFDTDTAILDLLPQSVEEAYERLLQRIDPKQRSNARQILLIIVGARRPLTVGEMAWALGTAQAERAQFIQIKSLNVEHLEKQIKHWCGLFVFIQNSTLFLIHQTAKDFLISKDLEATAGPNTWKNCLNSQQVELELLKICTMYLRFAPKGAQQYEDEEAQDLNSPNVDHHVSFFQYCAQYWPVHSLSDISPADGPLFDRILVLYDDQKKVFFAWFHHFWKAFRSHLPRGRLSSQHVMALNGHHGILAYLHRMRPFDLGVKDGTNTTPLHWAVLYGHVETSRWLVEHGADVNAQPNIFGQTALSAACGANQTEIVQMLLDNGANDLNGALRTASYVGHVQIVQMLLDQGANNLGSALQVASFNGHVQIVQILLDKGARIYESAVMGASRRGHSKIVQMLGDKNPGCDNKALWVASEEGHVQIVQMLLDRGADDFNSALQMALRGGHAQIVQMLLDRGAGNSGLAWLLKSIQVRTRIERLLRGQGVCSSDNGVLQSHDKA